MHYHSCEHGKERKKIARVFTGDDVESVLEILITYIRKREREKKKFIYSTIEKHAAKFVLIGNIKNYYKRLLF